MIKFYNAILKVRKWKRLAESFFDPRLHLIINGMLCPRILPDMYFSIQFYSAHSGKKNHPELGQKAWENLFISMARMGSSPVNQVWLGLCDMEYCD